MQVTLANWRTAPFNRWAFHHVRELVPSADIANDPARVRSLPREEMALGLEGFFQETDTDGMAVLHRGRLVFERYANGMTDETPHILMSVSKSMLGLLVAETGIDPERAVLDFIPELKGTAYSQATVRHLLDMRAGIVWDEDYLATSGPIIEYRKATGWNPLAPGDTPTDLRSFYKKLTEAEPQGGPVHYVSPNSDLLAWVVERATGGMCATLRDLARVGQWLIEAMPDFLAKLGEGDAAAWASGDMAKYYPGLPMRYRSQWYAVDGEAPLVFGMGIHGQNLFIDRANTIVIAKFSSQAAPLDAARIGLTTRAVSQLRKFLA